MIMELIIQELIANDPGFKTLVLDIELTDDDMKLWGQFCEALDQNTNITSIKLCLPLLKIMDRDSWQAFNIALVKRHNNQKPIKLDLTESALATIQAIYSEKATFFSKKQSESGNSIDKNISEGILSSLWTWNKRQELWQEISEIIARTQYITNINMYSLWPFDVNDECFLEFSRSIAASKSIYKFHFGDNILKNMADDRLSILFQGIIGNKSIKELEINFNTFPAMGDERWTQFCSVIAGRNLTGLKMVGSDMLKTDQMTENRWKELCTAIAKNPNLVDLFFYQVPLGRMNDANWKILLDAFALNQTLNALNLQEVQLYKLQNIDRWKQLCDIIASSRAPIKTLNFAENVLNQFTDHQWTVLCDAIAVNKTINHIDFSKNILNHISEARSNILFATLNKNPRIRKLNLQRFTYASDPLLNVIKILGLGHIDARPKNELQWKQICECIAHNQTLKFLMLAGNVLGQLNDKQWQQFCRVIRLNQSLTVLDLSSNQLIELNAFCWTEFCNAIAANKSLTWLLLDHNDLGRLSERRWKEFYSAILANPLIVDVNQNYDFSSKQNSERNKNIDKLVTGKKRDILLAAAHVLTSSTAIQSFRPKTTRPTLPGDIAARILEMLYSSKTLNDKIFEKIEQHDAKIMKEMARSIQSVTSVLEDLRKRLLANIERMTAISQELEELEGLSGTATSRTLDKLTVAVELAEVLDAELPEALELRNAVETVKPEHVRSLLRKLNPLKTRTISVVDSSTKYIKSMEEYIVKQKEFKGLITEHDAAKAEHDDSKAEKAEKRNRKFV